MVAETVTADAFVAASRVGAVAVLQVPVFLAFHESRFSYRRWGRSNFKSQNAKLLCPSLALGTLYAKVFSFKL